VPHFTIVPAVLAQTDLAVIMPSRPAANFARSGELTVVNSDIALPPFTVSLHWSWRHHNDPGLRWLREQIVALFAEPPAGRVARGG
jgi:DNA-binding transcriptional LysR family regulator